ncbi:hypothetical protein NPIL_656931, partial [Nephila pilipes]
IPTLTKSVPFDYFKNWNKEARFMPGIDLVVVSKSTCK